MNWKMFAFMILLPIINGERKYRKLTKHVLPNHKIINPLKEEERELLLLTQDPVCSFPE